jgi:hypothetical protein
MIEANIAVLNGKSISEVSEEFDSKQVNMYLITG